MYIVQESAGARENKEEKNKSETLLATLSGDSNSRAIHELVKALHRADVALQDLHHRLQPVVHGFLEARVLFG